MKLFSAAACAFLLWILQDVLFHRFWARGLCVSLDFNCRGVTEGERGILRETITNAKALPLPVLHVKFHMGKHLVFTASGNSRITDHNYRSDIFSCMPWQKIRRTLEFDCRRRGYYSIDQVQLVSYDLFFSSRYVASLPARAAFYVYPGAADPGRLTLPFRSLTGQILAQKALIPDPFETRSVRPYETCDPYRSVNWKATARAGRLLTNLHESTLSQRVVLAIDTEGGGLQGDFLAEAGVRVACSLAERLLAEGIELSLYSNGGDVRTGGDWKLEGVSGAGSTLFLKEKLACLQLGAGLPPVCDFLPQGLDAEDLLVLVSRNQRDQLGEAFSQALGRGHGLRVIPCGLGTSEKGREELLQFSNIEPVWMEF